jgi:hypothetical protein
MCGEFVENKGQNNFFFKIMSWPIAAFVVAGSVHMFARMCRIAISWPRSVPELL